MTSAIRIAALATLLGLAATAGAQDAQPGHPALPEAPRASVDNFRHSAIHLEDREVELRMRTTTRSLPKPLGRKFWLLSAAGSGAMAFDGWTTRRNLDRGAREHNWILGPSPSTGRMAATGALAEGGLMLTGAWLRRRGSRWWWAPQVGQIGLSVFCGVRNLRRVS